MSSLIKAQREWAMDYMARETFSVSRPGLFDTGTTYDSGMNFCEAFQEEFPGRTADPNLKATSKRLAKLLRAMWEDGLVQRGILGNQKDLRNEPSWQYVYSLYPVDHQRRRAAIRAAAGSQ